MMRVVASMACLLTAMDSAKNALGAGTQTLIADPYLWVWWISVASWIGAIPMIWMTLKPK